MGKTAPRPEERHHMKAKNAVLQLIEYALITISVFLGILFLVLICLER